MRRGRNPPTHRAFPIPGPTIRVRRLKPPALPGTTAQGWARMGRAYREWAWSRRTSARRRGTYGGGSALPRRGRQLCTAPGRRRRWRWWRARGLRNCRRAVAAHASACCAAECNRHGRTDRRRSGRIRQVPGLRCCGWCAWKRKRRSRAGAAAAAAVPEGTVRVAVQSEPAWRSADCSRSGGPGRWVRGVGFGRRRQVVDRGRDGGG